VYQPTLEVGDGTSTLRIEVKPSFLSGHGTLHGSVYFKVLDDACAFAVYSDDEFAAATISFTTYFLKPVTAGTIEAHGRVISRSGRLCVAEGYVQSDGHEVACGSGTYMRTRDAFESLRGYA
jgi:uncharacterized protein (TIGR00369 family)